ncbi:MAG: hypothetical protein IH901_05610 [Proteobacteria bacterium]|nr:hypothetical protein [Pseudomonadota bacterium]
MEKKNIIIFAAGAIILMGVYPPFHQVIGAGARLDKGYSFLWDSPPLASIDFGRLLLQWVIVGVIFGVVYYFRRDK